MHSRIFTLVLSAISITSPFLLTVSVSAAPVAQSDVAEVESAHFEKRFLDGIEEAASSDHQKRFLDDIEAAASSHHQKRFQGFKPTTFSNVVANSKPCSALGGGPGSTCVTNPIGSGPYPGYGTPKSL